MWVLLLCLAFGAVRAVARRVAVRARGVGVKLTGTWSYVLQHGSVTTSAEVTEKSATTQIHESSIVGASSGGHTTVYCYCCCCCCCCLRLLLFLLLLLLRAKEERARGREMAIRDGRSRILFDEGRNITVGVMGGVHVAGEVRPSV